MTMLLPQNWPPLTEMDYARVLKCLSSQRYWRGDGQYVLELERDFAVGQESKYSLAVTNGTHALEVGLFASGISYGDEVLVPAFTFMSSASAVVFRGALPVPVDVDFETFCIDPNLIEASISPRTKAIMPVHMSGHACDMERICCIAKENSMAVVEDCAHALGAGYKFRSGRTARLGAIGDVGCFSFQSSKVISGGEGGMITTDSEVIYKAALSFSNYGWVPDGVPYGHFMVGSNYRMPELTAALVLGQLPQVAHYAEVRADAVKSFEALLSEFKSITLQKTLPYTERHGHFYFLVVLSNEGQFDRDKVVSILVENGIPARRAYPSFHKTKMFETLYEQRRDLAQLPSRIDYSQVHTPVSDWISECGFWLPHWFFVELASRRERCVDILRDIGIR